MKNMSLLARRLAAAASLAGILAMLAYATLQAQSTLTWEAVTPQAPIGAARIEVRLAGTDRPIPADQIKLTEQRIDMGPDGMAAMEAPLTPLPSPGPGILAFETEFSMAGRWGLTLSATIPGQTAPVKGTVIYTVKQEEKAEAAPPKDRKILYYRNPMGLPDISPTPKKDSMGMDYIPVYEDEASAPSGTVQVSLDKVQRAGVRLETVARKRLSRSVRAVGTVAPDESKLAVVAVKFNGFIEELFVPVTGAKVRAGEPLMRVWIESPEVLRRQVDYALSLTGGKTGAESALYNLKVYGFDQNALDEIKKRGGAIRSIIWTAPISGTVLQKPAITGMRFNSGDTLFKLADLSILWVMAEVPERDFGLIRVGQKASLNFKAFPDKSFEGKVAFIYPEINAATRSGIVRIELPNPDGLIASGLYADVAIEAVLDESEVIAIPQSAVIDNGTRPVAFVAKGDGRFEPRHLQLGRRGDNDVEVKQGLKEGEEIVSTGNFLIDAESNLRAALAAFTADRASAKTAGATQ